MILSFDELKTKSFSLCDVEVIRQQPPYRVLQVEKRRCNGFIFVQSGECLYTFDEGEFRLSAGAVAYLPRASRHTLTVLSEQICFYRINFTLCVSGEPVLFSSHPIKLTTEATPECVEAITALEACLAQEENTVFKTEKLCTVLSSLLSGGVSPVSRRLLPALRYLQEHLTESICCEELARLCFLGSSRFYELFKAELGVSPLEYRNRLRLHRAIALLSEGDMSIKMAALSVGFESAAYFSRHFKRSMGISPSEYLRRNR